VCYILLANMNDQKQLNWLFDDCIPHTVSTPAVEPKPNVKPTKKTKKQVLKPARELRIVPVSSRSRETITEYRRKLFARLRAAKNPKEIAALMNRI
jgi:hypothetical protein